MRWTRKSIVTEIKRLHADGAELNYATAEDNHLNLVRAAAWHFGTWRRAVEAAGIDYESISKYQRWDRKRIVSRIRELHHEGADLNWRAVSTQVDPPLAAAALRPNGFQNWREAIEASGLDINDVARYQAWDEERVVKDIKALHRARKPLSSKAVQVANQPLFCAARRRFGSWDEALVAAGLSVDKIRLRQPSAAPYGTLHRNGTAPRNGTTSRAAGSRNTASATKPRAATAAATQGRTTRATTAQLLGGKTAGKAANTVKTKTAQSAPRPAKTGRGAKVPTQVAARPAPNKTASGTASTRNARTQPATTRQGTSKSTVKATKPIAARATAAKGRVVKATAAKSTTTRAGATKAPAKVSSKSAAKRR